MPVVNLNSKAGLENQPQPYKFMVQHSPTALFAGYLTDEVQPTVQQ